MATPTAFFEGAFVPLEQANINIMTHAFNYGTAVFEGIRGNWNEEQGELYLFKVREHVQRIRQSAKIMRMEIRYTDDEIASMVQQVAERSGYREDVYIRPMVYKASKVVGLRMHNLDDEFLIYATPFGAYLDPDAGARCMTSSWRRVDDTAIPARAKVTGIYVNNSMAKTEAQLNGFDEAIMLNNDGHVSEGSGENIVIVRHGQLITPPPADNVLEGITLETALALAKTHLGLEVERRSIDRTELYIADELFMTGTAAHVTPITELDRVPIGSGAPGPISKEIQRLYFQMITGRMPQYLDWLTPVFKDAAVGAKA